jgi:L-asparaginase
VTRPTIAVVGTGGTIESIGKDRFDLAWYPDTGKKLGEGELLAAVPELEKIAAVRWISSRPALKDPAISDWFALLQRIHRSVADGADGVVVTYGTNPLEEVAYFLHLTAKVSVPLVVTGAMRPSSAIGADGYLNLMNSVQVACDRAALGTGVLVVMNETIFSARDVTKSNAHRVQSFQARDNGPLGYIDADGVALMHRPTRPHTTATEFDVADRQDLPRVDIVVSYVGSDGALIDAAVRAGAQGIVSAGSGAGRPTAAENEALDRAAAGGVVVCQATRTGSGRITRSPWLKRRKLVASGDLQPWKARVLLALALTASSDVEQVQRMFDTY